MFYGTFSSHEDYFVFGNDPNEVKKMLWKLYCNNCFYKPDKDDKRIFESEHSIDEYKAPNVVQLVGFSTSDRGRLYTLSGNKLVELHEVKK